jgi:hypothetical protein
MANISAIPYEENMIVVKIYTPFGNMLAGNYTKVQNEVDTALCDAMYQFNVLFYGYSNDDMYLKYARNSEGPDQNPQETVLIEYYINGTTANPDVEKALKLIHQAIIKQFGSPSLNVT